jgi:RNA polymerase sigma factor (sigma-70 family)
MRDAASLQRMTRQQDQRIAAVIKEQQLRLRNFIRKRVADPRDVEDILQDVFYRLVEANRLLMPIDHVTGWLFRVARNRIVDLFRKTKEDALHFEDLLPSPEAGPDAQYARKVLLEEFELAIDELPKEQRDVFIAHELEGHSFEKIAADTGVSINTLLSRKRYAVQRLRRRLQSIYDELTRT